MKQLKGVTPKIGWKAKPNQSKMELPTLETPMPGDSLSLSLSLSLFIDFAFSFDIAFTFINI